MGGEGEGSARGMELVMRAVDRGGGLDGVLGGKGGGGDGGWGSWAASQAVRAEGSMGQVGGWGSSLLEEVFPIAFFFD